MTGVQIFCRECGKNARFEHRNLREIMVCRNPECNKRDKGVTDGDWSQHIGFHTYGFSEPRTE